MIPTATRDALLAKISRHGLVPPEQLEVPDKDALLMNLMLGEAGLDVKLAAIIAAELNLEVAQLPEDALANRPFKGKISDAFIARKLVLPFKQEGQELHTAIAEPEGLQALNELKLITGCQVKAFIAPFHHFFPPVNIAAQQGKDKHIAMQQNPAATITNNADVNAFKAATGNDVVQFVDEVLNEAIVTGASDIHIEAFRGSARVRMRVDGGLCHATSFDEFLNINYAAVVTRLKIMASLDISERRLPQDGAIATELGEKTIDIRVSTLPAAHGERVVMRILDPDAANFTLDELGLQDIALQQLRKAIHSPQGMVLVTGPTGSGKSTTLYAMLKELNTPDVNIMTAEDPVEYDLPGVAQVQVRESIGLGFASALRSFLRQDPEIIMVGEIRDKETSDISIKAALTGHLVLSTLHTNNAPATITRLINMGVDDYLVTAALTMVIAQRLARLNCTHCLVADDAIKNDELFALGFTNEDLSRVKPMKGKGCDHCMGSGVKGRRAIHEVLPLTPSLREAINRGEGEDGLRKVALAEGFFPMQSAGRKLVEDGRISVKEYQRILMVE